MSDLRDAGLGKSLMEAKIENNAAQYNDPNWGIAMRDRYREHIEYNMRQHKYSYAAATDRLDRIADETAELCRRMREEHGFCTDFRTEVLVLNRWLNHP
jgi:hypothetical protein